jgi:hypothetical protein
VGVSNVTEHCCDEMPVSEEVLHGIQDLAQGASAAVEDFQRTTMRLLYYNVPLPQPFGGS